MSRPSNRESILEAAEAVVSSVGGAHLSLEAVAERAGISKGGLLYHFPNKESLLVAMVERCSRRFKAMRDESMPEGQAEPWQRVHAEMEVLTKLEYQDDRVASAMLAAMANQPELMAPIRNDMLARRDDLARDPAHFDRYMIYCLACDGLVLSELLQVSPLKPHERRAIITELLRMLEQDH